MAGFNQTLDNYTGDAPAGTKFVDEGAYVFGQKGKWNGNGADAIGAQEQARDAFARAREADRTAAPTINWGQYDQDQAGARAMRGEQRQGLDLYLDAADMSRQSQASQGLIDRQQQNQSNQLAIAGGALGGAQAQLAARRGVQLGGDVAQAQAWQQAQQIRSAEAAQARQAYAEGTTEMRAGDQRAGQLGLSAAQMAAENELRQRGLNAQREGNQNRLGFDVQNASLQGQLANADFNRRRLDAYNAAFFGDEEARNRVQGATLAAASTAIGGVGALAGKVAGGGGGNSGGGKDPYAGY